MGIKEEAPYQTIFEDSTNGSVAQFFSLRRQTQRWLVPTVLALVVIIGSWIAVGAIERTFRKNLRKKLLALVAATASSVELWGEQQTLHARIIAADDRIENLVRRQVEGDDSREELNRQKKALHSQISKNAEVFGFASISVVDSAGVLLATTVPDASAERFINASISSELSQVFCGEAVFANPSSSHDDHEADTPGSVQGVSSLRVAVPIENRRGDILATLVCTIRPDDQFRRILDVSSFGDTGHSIAVDQFGNSLSHEGSLSKLGIVRKLMEADREDASYEIVDPDGYVDESRTRVVGAAKWLPDYGMGVVSTIAYDEAYASHILFRRINGVVVGLAIAAAVSGLCYTWFLSRAQLRAMQAEKKLRKLGHYSLEEKIGEGGMGEVYRAKHAMLRRPTAVKLLRAEKNSAAAIERFEREVQYSSQLTHPNTISIYDFGRTEEGIFFYAMEYLDGLDLSKVVGRTGPLPEGRIVHILRQVCGSLKEAHQSGLVHRDIKPANVILCRRGGRHDVAKVLDFGLVHDVQRLREEEISGVTGTPAFMSPESISTPNDVDVRSDIYSLGAMAYFLLTGKYTFEGSNASEIWEQQLTQLPTAPSVRKKTSIARELEELTMRCLSIDPGDRPESIAEVEKILSEIESPWTQSEAAAWWRDMESASENAETDSQIAETVDLQLNEPKS